MSAPQKFRKKPVEIEAMQWDSLTTCPKSAREGRYLLTCCMPEGHHGDCWCSDIRIADEDGDHPEGGGFTPKAVQP